MPSSQISCAMCGAQPVRGRDEDALCSACDAQTFVEMVFAGRGLKFLSWHRDAIRGIFGPVTSEGERTVEEAYLELPKQNGKSAICAALGLYGLMDEDVDDGQIYGAATSRQQASIIFHHAVHLIRHNPFLAKQLKVLDSYKRIERKDGRASYQVLSADGAHADGIRGSVVIIDELHRWSAPRERTLFDVLRSGTISRPGSLIVQISTAGGAQHESELAFKAHERAMAFIKTGSKSDNFYAQIHAADQRLLADDPTYWRSREARVSANPSHEDRGGHLRDAKIAAFIERMPKGVYCRYHLNCWESGGENGAFEMADWDACGVPENLAGRRCFLGLDLSATTDLTALVAVFPDDDYVDAICFFWAAGNLSERELEDGVPYQAWLQSGHLEPSSGGPVVNYSAVADRIRWCIAQFDVITLAYDPRFASYVLDMLRDITDDDFFLPMSQGADKQSAPVKQLLELVQSRKLRHGGHPVLRHHAACAEVKADNSDSMRIVKPGYSTSSKRIDGIAALVTALYAAQQQPEPKYIEYHGLRHVG